MLVEDCVRATKGAAKGTDPIRLSHKTAVVEYSSPCRGSLYSPKNSAKRLSIWGIPKTKFCSLRVPDREAGSAKSTAQPM